MPEPAQLHPLNKADQKNVPDLAGFFKATSEAVSAAYDACNNKNNSPDDNRRFWQTYVQLNNAGVGSLIERARQEPDSAAAFDALEWIVCNRMVLAGVELLQPHALKAMELLRDQHTVNPRAGRTCAALAKNPNPVPQPAVEFLEAVAKNNPDRTARGGAIFALGHIIKLRADSLRERQFLQTLEHPVLTADKEWLAANTAESASPESLACEAAALFKDVLENYSDCPGFWRNSWKQRPFPTIGESARRDLQALEHVSIGCSAPEISGEDIQGRKMNLSEFRGRVVVLSFWASWCGPCVQMIPGERELVKRHEGKPFDLVGVNGDSRLDDVKKFMAEENVSWRSFWNGSDGPDGPIAAAWDVRGWPTVFFLDSGGIIRFKSCGYGGKRTEAILDAAVTRLLSQQ